MRTWLWCSMHLLVVLLPVTTEADLGIAFNRAMLPISELLKASSSWNHQRIALCSSRKFLVVQAANVWAVFLR